MCVAQKQTHPHGCGKDFRFEVAEAIAGSGGGTEEVVNWVPNEASNHCQECSQAGFEYLSLVTETGNSSKTLLGKLEAERISLPYLSHGRYFNHVNLGCHRICL